MLFCSFYTDISLYGLYNLQSLSEHSWHTWHSSGTVVNIWSFCLLPYPHSQRIVDVRSPLWSHWFIQGRLIIPTLLRGIEVGLKIYSCHLVKCSKDFQSSFLWPLTLHSRTQPTCVCFLGFWRKCGPQHTSLSLTSPTHPSQVRSISSLELAWSHLHESWAVWMQW